MITLGVDLASQPARTAICLVDWSAPAVLDHRLGVDDADLLRLIGAADKTGIDAPLGWPVDFVRAVAADDWGADTAQLTHRATDRWLRAETGKVPLSVSTDRIAYCAFRAARLLAQLPNVDRAGLTGPVCEVYPDPALVRYGFRAKGASSYKREAVAARKAIVAGFPDWVDRAACIASDDLLDAFVCALIARDVLAGDVEPIPAELLDVARREGWIHLPREHPR